MSQRSDESPRESQDAGSSGSVFARVVRFCRMHPLGVLQGFVFSLVAIIVLQNLEPTSIDVLFWSIEGLPKLVLIFLSMLVGAAIWELVRRSLR